MMATGEIVLLCAGALIAAILWFFLRLPRGARSLPQPEVDEIVVELDRGYWPEVVVLRRGVPAKIRLLRADSSEESGEIFFPWFHVHRKLPPQKTTTIDLQGDEAGDFPFHSKTGALRGRIVVT